MFKRYVAQRKLKNTCLSCGKHFEKGDVYYKERRVDVEEVLFNKSNIYACNLYKCPRCKYKDEEHQKRFKEFSKICEHPDKFMNTIWGYIPGESVREPEYFRCMLCGKIL